MTDGLIPLPGKEQFKTLAQTGTMKIRNSSKKPVLVQGTGSDLTNEKMIKGRGKRKIITQSLALHLIKVAEKKQDTKFIKAFWNTYHCQNQVHSSKDRIYGKFCKNRFCTICLAIRKADLINRYMPVLRAWEDPYFVTLTVKAVTAGQLKNRINRGMIRGFKLITERCKKRHQRGKGPKLIGVKSLECNFNPQKQTYNPHFHLIVPSKEIADLLTREWLQLWTRKFANPLGQHMRPVFKLEAGLMEIIKYGTKIFTEPELEKQTKIKNKPLVYAAAMYNILDAMKGHRLFERFGFNLPGPRSKKQSGKEITDYEKWIYDLKSHDWENSETGNKLSNYLPSSELLSILFNNIDVELE